MHGGLLHGMTPVCYSHGHAGHAPRSSTSPKDCIRDMVQLERAVLWATTGSGEVQRVIASCTFQPRIQAFTKLITLCGRTGDAAKAQEVFEAMKLFDSKNVKPNAYSYSALIFALGNGGMWEEALAAFEEMKLAAKTDPQCQPSLISYSSAISACEKGHRADLAIDLYHAMVGEGIRPDRVVFLSLLEACIQEGDWSNATSMLEVMHSHGFAASSRIYKYFLEELAAHGKSGESLDLFLTLQMFGQDPDAGMCELLLECFAKDGRSDLASHLLKSMHEARIELPSNAHCFMAETAIPHGYMTQV